MPLSVLTVRDTLGVTSNKFLIDGQWVDAGGTRSHQHRNPATNEVIAEIPFAEPDEVDRAIKSARRAFDEGPWPKMKAAERTKVLLRIADLFDKHADELTRLQTLDNAIPYAVSNRVGFTGELGGHIFRHHAGWIDKITGHSYPQFTDNVPMRMVSVREPVGVTVGITPWNAPLLQFPEKVAPALAAGCTILIKSSEFAPHASTRMAELVQEADLPPGVFQYLTGDGVTGDALVRHPGVDKISFTGSRAVGEHIQSVAAQGIKRVTLELGGKSPALVFPDVPDLKAAAHGVMGMMSMFLSGQVCSTTSRAIVHRDIYEEFISHAQEQVQTVRFGDPFADTTTSAPIINPRQLDKIQGFVDQGKTEGRMVFGGTRPGGDLEQGNWYNPTLFADVGSNATIAQEEIFGPVLTVIPFETEEEAIRIANDSQYGLSAGIYTGSNGRAWRVGQGLRTGTVGVNGYSFQPNSPFGGFKASGLGREGGFTSIEAFTELKTMIFNLNV
ncbi:aldehyde dehydrogenase family protein [Mameliella sediminis]|uniref:aldehyde dehydrogenase family protein n=1 Tax=Mameliella sediminis TaxID=2836866 RepID=UPI001C440460|nr:aldehyde dehydrogenase family protein [Mameliella sediminis]MBY6114862.1 aldehyde dehydrogenase family protein [Antarctobacter heliothermus]MBY6144435.1 aldehyde dehydrogenase family protein [Mameliella alba]MBV7392657.1 aldehyde dehydrogenase family protein [Mameliella sediminis]MBY6163497.1 aldehyde dehydrogenase family protein [Mameliella alba]MBY6171760.1 aldehyde dehydrogenase family protein [Mameliella alba]